MSLSPESDIVAFGVDSRDVMANYRHICEEGNYLILPGIRGIKRKQLGLHAVKDKPQNKAI